MDLQTLKIDRNPQPPAARRRRSAWPWRLAALGAAGVAAWLFWRPLGDLVDQLRLQPVRTLLVTDLAPAAAAAVRGTAANGYVVAARRAALSSDVPGRIVELSVREGSVVKRGDVVARLYADEFRAALQRAEADLAAAEAGVQRSEAAQVASRAELAQAEAATVTARAQRDEGAATVQWLEGELARVQELLAAGIGADRDLQRAQTDLDAGRARLAALTAAVAGAETATATARQRLAVAGGDLAVVQAQREVAAAARDLAQATLDKTDVRAPFDGIVVLKDAEVGEVVSPNVQGGSNARGAVCTMVDFDSLEVQANVPETSLGSVRLGAPADVFLDAFPDDRYDGVVDRIWPTADRQKATVEVRVRLLRKDERLRPEMGVRIVFRDPADTAETAAPERRALVVPEPAVVQVGGDQGVFVVERDRVRFTPVRTGERKGGRVAIDQGLAPGSRIVVDPPPTLQDGDRVRVAAN
ncbi:MAG: efflux RND transporter periplasmic adaptor subunit [Planctomycetes bacterium]|nr:efflux RND transporter periplasmic adaptor subunit [Planctomycetota bacterium]